MFTSGWDIHNSWSFGSSFLSYACDYRHRHCHIKWWGSTKHILEYGIKRQLYFGAKISFPSMFSTNCLNTPCVLFLSCLDQLVDPWKGLISTPTKQLYCHKMSLYFCSKSKIYLHWKEEKLKFTIKDKAKWSPQSMVKVQLGILRTTSLSMFFTAH